ncbi:uncharacterized protein FLJ43738, partial [Solea solea]|uniref:uncharacterized protein FLJ43738 n=1 Tax=Solea solea TaxID=90069 RepID=UPI00272A4064
MTDEEDASFLETDLSFMEDGLENKSSSTEDIKSQKDDRAYETYHCLGDGTDVPAAPEKAKKTNTDSSIVWVKAHKTQRCYHVEYKLLPGDTETIKVDLLVFGPVAKMCKDDEFKILRTWHEGEQTWVGWTHSINVRVNRDMLIGLLRHKIELQIWTSKDKLSSQARHERLKACRLSQDQPEDATHTCDDTKSMVNKLRALCEKTSNTSMKHKFNMSFKSNSDVGSETEKNLAAFQKPKTDACDLGNTKENNITSLEISPMCFLYFPLLFLWLPGETSVTECFPVCSSSLFEVMCNVSLDSPLVSDQLKSDLNPLVIMILSASSMPSSPVPFHVLQEMCTPVYCQYKFHNLSVHRTNYHEHASDIYFRDVNVILTGLMSPQELQHFLASPPLQIEVHDRDRMLEEMPETLALGTAGSDEDTQSNAALLRHKTMGFNSYGLANLNLSEMLLGKKSLTVNLPIKCGPPPPKLDRERSALKTTDAAARREPMPQAHYYDANSQLKVRVEIACPLNSKDTGSESYDGSFGRIIFLFHHNNVSVMTKLRSEILRINALAFNLHFLSHKYIERALSNNKGLMNLKGNESEDLDFVTGFHVRDKRTHIFVLEGLKHKAVRRLWEAVPMKTECLNSIQYPVLFCRMRGSEEEQVIVLYNSDLGFFKRLYDSLDVSLSPIYLYESLQTIIQQPLIYIRDVVPQRCFQALSRLSQLCKARQLKDVVRYNLFPSADMIVSMSEECGTSAEQWEEKARAHTEMDLPTPSVRMKRHAPVNTHNREYIQWKRNSQQMPFQPFRDFMQENIQKVQDQSEKLQKPKPAALMVDWATIRPTHSYSIQTFNLHDRGRELLHKEMAKVPGRRFTYSQEYLSATVEPGDVTPKNDCRAASVSTVWVTGFISGRSRVHPRHPDEARVEELRKPWRENILHANTLKPTLSRDMWVCGRRSEDFQLYSKPPPFFTTSPLTIHLAGESLQQEQLEAARARYRRWLRKLLPGSGTERPDNGSIPQF